MTDLMTRGNVNEFLTTFIGIPEDEVSLMPDYVKRGLVEDDYDLFLEYFDQGV